MVDIQIILASNQGYHEPGIRAHTRTTVPYISSKHNRSLKGKEGRSSAKFCVVQQHVKAQLVHVDGQPCDCPPLADRVALSRKGDVERTGLSLPHHLHFQGAAMVLGVLLGTNVLPGRRQSQRTRRALAWT